MQRIRQHASATSNQARRLLPLALGLLIVSCADQQSEDSLAPESLSMGEVTVEQLHDVLKGDAEVMLVDVRTPEEWEAVRATGIDHFIPFEELPGRHDELGVSKQTPIYLICRSGRRSGIAGERLVGLGYENVFNVLAGTNAWVAAGYPTTSGPIKPSSEEDSP